MEKRYHLFCSIRCHLITKKEDRLSVQYVPPNIYDADYPVWIMSKEKLINFFYGKYNIFLEFESHLKIKIDGEWKSYEGFLMKRG